MPHYPTAPVTDGTDAENLGRAARIAGQPRSPFVHPTFGPQVSAGKVGVNTDLMVAYARGWDREDHRLADEELRRDGIL